MSNFWKIFNLLVLGFLISLCVVGTFFKQISFGLGLGDLFGIAFLYAATLIHIVLTFSFRKNKTNRYMVLSLIFLVLSIAISLKATIWRGAEYRWNGDLFYTPCAKDIQIENPKGIRNVKVSMCTMTYYSKFLAKWDGEKMKYISGEILIPEKLKKYIKYPVEYLYIESAYAEQIVDGVGKQVPYFDLNQLELNNEYTLGGEINKVKDGRPVFVVRIKK